MADLTTLERVLATHGSDRTRWPAELHGELTALLEASAEARALLEAEAELDRLLAAAPTPAPAGSELASKIMAELPARGRVFPLRANRLLAFGAPLAAAAALALWLLGPEHPAPKAPGLTASSLQLAGLERGSAELDPAATDSQPPLKRQAADKTLLALAESDTFSWEVPGDAFLVVAHLDPLLDVPEWGCTDDDLGCLDLGDPWGNEQHSRSTAPERKWT